MKYLIYQIIITIFFYITLDLDSLLYIFQDVFLNDILKLKILDKLFIYFINKIYYNKKIG